MTSAQDNMKYHSKGILLPYCILSAGSPYYKRVASVQVYFFNKCKFLNVITGGTNPSNLSYKVQSI